MKTATVREIKTELNDKSPKELIDLCLTLSKFKKENKELLTYLLYEKHNEEEYISGIKEETLELFEQVNTKSLYYIKKSVRKILRNIKKYIRYSKNKETEVELLIFFCAELKNLNPYYGNSKVLRNIFEKQVEFIIRKIKSLHEDLQFDYLRMLEEL